MTSLDAVGGESFVTICWPYLAKETVAGNCHVLGSLRCKYIPV